MKRAISILLFGLLTALPTLAADTVKKSRSNICHPPQSPHYEKVTRFTSFENVRACIESGGRLPKGIVSKLNITPKDVEIQVSPAPYDRKQYPHWIDEDGDCQNTRHELLLAQSIKPVKFKRNKGCTVTWGYWFDPYTNQYFDKASDLDIDHVVPLYYAHQHGASLWNKAKRRAFANDTDNLLIVDDGENQTKSASPPHEYMPPSKAFHCEYIKRWNHVMKKYELRRTQKEQSFVKAKLAECGGL